MTNGEINIQQVLAEITATDRDGQTFLLKVVRATGKQAGSIKVIAKARKGGPEKAHTIATDRKKALHKDKGTIPIVDVEADQYMSILISHIIQFNDKKVIH